MIGIFDQSITQSFSHPLSMVLDNSSFCHYISYCFAPDGVQANMGAVGDRTGSKAVP